VSFDPVKLQAGEVDRKPVVIMHTAEAKITDEDLAAECGVYYLLRVHDGTSWMPWLDLVDILRAENPDLNSNVHFDPNSGDFFADFSSSDYEAHKARFTD
jgi:hypothetical protein